MCVTVGKWIRLFVLGFFFVSVDSDEVLGVVLFFVVSDM